MKLVQINSLFSISYGNKLDLNKMTLAEDGVAFVSRTGRGNGVAAMVKKEERIAPYEPGSLTIALGGSVLASFLQVKPFYTGQNVAVATPISPMEESELLFYAACIEENKFRYSACGREANRTFRTLLVPCRTEIPAWVKKTSVDQFSQAAASEQAAQHPALLATGCWKEFKLDELFDIERGRGARSKDIVKGEGEIPFITSTDQDNGLSGFTGKAPCHSGNVITLTRNGSVGEAFYQPIDFCSTEDVHVLKPKFLLTVEIALFLTTLLRLEKYRFNYGRKWGLERMKSSVIKLPVDAAGLPDWEFMKIYIKSLPFSSQLSA